jgi:hypothetical protein
MLPLSIIAAALMFTNYWLGLILYIALIVIAMVFSLVFAVAVTVWTTRFYISVTGQTLYRKEV